MEGRKRRARLAACAGLALALGGLAPAAPALAAVTVANGSGGATTAVTARGGSLALDERDEAGYPTGNVVVTVATSLPAAVAGDNSLVGSDAAYMENAGSVGVLLTGVRAGAVAGGFSVVEDVSAVSTPNAAEAVVRLGAADAQGAVRFSLADALDGVVAPSSGSLPVAIAAGGTLPVAVESGRVARVDAGFRAQGASRGLAKVTWEFQAGTQQGGE